jgi:hypothetical protein
MYPKLGFGSPSFAYMQEDPMWLTHNQKKILPFNCNTNSNSKRELERFENPSHAEFWSFVPSMSDFNDNSRIAHNLAWDDKARINHQPLLISVIELPLKSSCLWPVVWTCNPWFIPNIV